MIGWCGPSGHQPGQEHKAVLLRDSQHVSCGLSEGSEVRVALLLKHDSRESFFSTRRVTHVDSLREQPVHIKLCVVRSTLNILAASVQTLVVNQHSDIRVLQQGMRAQDGVIEHRIIHEINFIGLALLRAALRLLLSLLRPLLQLLWQDDVQSVFTALSALSLPSFFSLLSSSASPAPRWVSSTPSPSRACSAALLAARQTLRLHLALRMVDPSSIWLHHALLHHVMFDAWLSSYVWFTSPSFPFSPLLHRAPPEPSPLSPVYLARSCALLDSSLAPLWASPPPTHSALSFSPHVHLHLRLHFVPFLVASLHLLLGARPRTVPPAFSLLFLPPAPPACPTPMSRQSHHLSFDRSVLSSFLALPLFCFWVWCALGLSKPPTPISLRHMDPLIVLILPPILPRALPSKSPLFLLVFSVSPNLSLCSSEETCTSSACPHLFKATQSRPARPSSAPASPFAVPLLWHALFSYVPFLQLFAPPTPLPSAAHLNPHSTNPLCPLSNPENSWAFVRYKCIFCSHFKLPPDTPSAASRYSFSSSIIWITASLSRSRIAVPLSLFRSAAHFWLASLPLFLLSVCFRKPGILFTTCTVLPLSVPQLLSSSLLRICLSSYAPYASRFARCHLLCRSVTHPAEMSCLRPLRATPPPFFCWSFSWLLPNPSRSQEAAHSPFLEPFLLRPFSSLLLHLLFSILTLLPCFFFAPLALPVDAVGCCAAAARPFAGLSNWWEPGVRLECPWLCHWP